MWEEISLTYWDLIEWFWLRSPNDNNDNNALLAAPGNGVFDYGVFRAHGVRPASNLNLSSVLFASAGTAASSGTAVSGTIASDTAMTLRLDGTDKNIGTVTYNTATGDIKVAKGSTEGNVALVVQGRGTVGGVENDWYYSKQITGTETVNVSAIVSETNTPSSIDLSTCKIWLETTDSTKNLTYAVGATEVVSIASVAITGFSAPAANTALSTSASCATPGVSSTTPPVTWTPNDSTAGYNTSYTASITLTADIGYEFADNVTATVLENNATSLTKNADGTLTVTYDFSATAKRVIGSVTAPTVPANNTFANYYTASSILTNGGNSELGTTAKVTFEGSVAPATVDMAVTWTLENAGGAEYNATPGAENTFRWTVNADAYKDYDAASNNISMSGTVKITNKAVAVTSGGGSSGGTNSNKNTVWNDAKVPKDILEIIKDKNIDVIFDLGNGITWKVNGNDIKNISGDIDLGVKLNTNTIPVDVINKVTGEKTSLQISLNHDGDFGFTATLTINLDSKNKGLYANLFYYNPKAEEGKELEFICADEIDEKGNADLVFTHASDYTIVIDQTPMNVEEPEPDTPTATAPKKGTLLTDSKTKMVYKVTKSGTAGGTVQFVKTKNTEAKTVTIPATVTVDGITYKVTSIATGALKNNKTVTIGKYVTTIGSSAFSGCTKLKKVTIGKRVTSIGSKAFTGIYKEAAIKVPESKYTSYKKLLRAKGVSSKAKINKIES